MSKKRKSISDTLPADLTPDDVKAFFSLPDDDDSMHQQPSVVRHPAFLTEVEIARLCGGGRKRRS